MDDNLIRVVVTAVVPYENGFLFVKAKKDGKWGLPGGHVKPFENPERAIPREIREETGLEVVVKNVIGIYSNKSSREHHISNTIYFALVKGGEINITKKDEILEIRALTLTEIRDLYDNKELRSIGSLLGVEDYLKGRKYPLEIIKHDLE